MPIEVKSQSKALVKKGFLAKTGIRRNWDLYLMLLPVLAFFLIFHYVPMAGIQIAFKDFAATKGIWESPWVGLKHFQRFFQSYYFERLIKNTLGVSFYQILAGFPLPIILAILINEMRSKHFRKVVQLATYAPHFLSVVVVVGMLTQFLAPNTGIVNHIVAALGGERFNFMASPAWFKTLYVFSGIWQNAGWGTIIYIAAITGIDLQVYEAAMVDGATKLQRIFYITLPFIIPTAVIMLILDCGKIMNIGFEKIYLMQNDLNMDASDVISTYVYRNGIQGAQYSFSAAVGLFNSVINFILVVMVNSVSKRLSETSLW